MSIPVSTNHRTGSGCGDTDLKPVDISMATSSSGTGSIPSDALLDPSKTGLISDNNAREPVFSLRILPGYGYVGDREFYLYKRKIVLIVRSVVHNDIAYIKLKSSENENYVPPVPVNPKQGKAPILVYRIDQTIGESILGSSQMITMECPVTPTVDLGLWDLDTSSGYAWTYSYWRDDGSSLSPSEYMYNPATTELSCRGVHSGGIYAVVYEGSSYPIECSLDLNPLVSPPESGIICITPGTKDQAAVVGSIELLASDSGIPGSVIKITAIVKSITGNRIAGSRIVFGLSRKDLPSTSSTLSYTQIADEGSITLAGSGMTIDMVKDVGGSSPRIDGYVYGTAKRVNGNTAVPAIGYLSALPNSYTAGNYMTAVTTDANGNASVYLHRLPSTSPNAAISIPADIVAYHVPTGDSDNPAIIPSHAGRIRVFSGHGERSFRNWINGIPCVTGGHRETITIRESTPDILQSSEYGFTIRISSVAARFMSFTSLQIYSVESLMNRAVNGTEIQPIPIINITVTGSGSSRVVHLICYQTIDITYGIVLDGVVADPVYLVNECGFLR